MADFILLTVTCPSELSDILIAELGELGFDSFQEEENGFLGAISSAQFDADFVSEVFKRYKVQGEITWDQAFVNKENWNKKWEENYEPVFVEDKIVVRASFHKIEKRYPYDIIINPKMSFGTGHHETTWLMLKQELALDMKSKLVLDAGCGTGVLSIMASKLGARKIVGFDIEEWAVENAIENLELNGVEGFIVNGSIDRIAEKEFDVILANINKNVLLEHLQEYADRLVENGSLLISGFYTEDIDDLIIAAEKANLKKIESSAKNNWALLVFKKSNGQ